MALLHPANTFSCFHQNHKYELKILICCYCCLVLTVIYYPDGVNNSGSYLSRFESSQWLSYVSEALAVAKKAAQYIAESNWSVILQGQPCHVLRVNRVTYYDSYCRVSHVTY